MVCFLNNSVRVVALLKSCYTQTDEQLSAVLLSKGEHA